MRAARHSTSGAAWLISGAIGAAVGFVAGPAVKRWMLDLDQHDRTY